MHTIDHTRMVTNAQMIAHQLDRMAAQARDDESLQAHFPLIDQLADLSGDLADMIEEACRLLPGVAWIVEP